MRRLLAAFSTRSLVVSLLATVASVTAIACSTGSPSGGDDDTASGAKGGTGDAGKSSAGTTSGGKPSVGGSAGATAGTGTAAGGLGGTGGVGGAAGSAALGGTAGTAGAAAGAGGSAGTVATAGTGGAAGSTALGGAAGLGAGGIGGSPLGGAGGAAGSGGPPACPTGALFCSGFEDAALPTGATYLSSNDNNDWTKGTALDKTVFHAGAQSIEILKIGSYSQRELVVPAAQTFWFRAYLRTDVAIGGAMGNNHNLFFEAAWEGGDKGVEIVEEDCMLGMNISDTRYGSNGTKNQPGCPTSGDMGTQLDANNWHCFEGYFNGMTGDVQVYVDNGVNPVVSMTGEAGAKNNYSTLRFGYRQYHERQRLVWYDDVATAPARIGCN